MCGGSCAQRVFLQAPMCMWTPLVPVCGHIQRLWYPVSDRYLQKCLWADLRGFLLLKGPVDLKVDCRDVISPCRSSTPPCITVTIHLRPACEKKPNNFISISALTQTVRLNTGTTVTLPEPLPKKMCCSTVFMLTQLIQTNAGPDMHFKSDLVNVSLF